MEYVRIVTRLTLAFFYVLLGLFLVGIVFLFLPWKYREKVVCVWSKGLLKICGVKVVLHGRPVTKGPMMWISNHVSWLDIFSMNAIRGTCFIAKQEIRRMPVLGYLVHAAGTLFIERGSREKVPYMNEMIMERLGMGRCVGLFPEGYISDGTDVLHMHAGLLESVIQSKTPLQAITLVYTREGRFQKDVPWTGTQSFFDNICAVIRYRSTEVNMHFSPLLIQSGETLTENRIELVERAKILIQENLDCYQKEFEL